MAGWCCTKVRRRTDRKRQRSWPTARQSSCISAETAATVRAEPSRWERWRRSAHVVIFDHRGYGENPGNPSEKHLAADARSIWDRLTKTLGVAPERIVIYGESLGGGVAVRLASELCRDGQPPGGLILQSTFSSLADAGSELYWFLPVQWLLVDRYESVKRIPFVSCPILQLHGRNDRIVPLHLGQRLFEAAPPESTSGLAKRQVILEHADHNDVYSREGATVIAEFSQFLQQATPPPAAAPPARGDQ